MNSKTIMAFLAGPLVVGGLLFVSGQFQSATPSKPVAKVQNELPAAENPEPAPVKERQAAMPAEPPRRWADAAPVREKPSPVARVVRDAAPVGARSAPLISEAPKADQKAADAPSAPAPPPVPQPVSAPSDARAQIPPPPPPPPNSVTLKSGTVLQVRVGETLSTAKTKPGDTFTMTLAEPLMVDGFVIAEKGARAMGRVVEAERAGKVKGVSHLTVELTKFTTSDGQSIPVRTAAFTKQGEKSTAKDAAKIGGGAALGAIIGAIAGGGKGAAIGAGAGGAAGTGDVLLTRGPDTTIPVETRLIFKVQENVTITERQ